MPSITDPSFHQRARSPSPDPSPQKGNSTEHHSRDSYRRRGHLSAKGKQQLCIIENQKSVPKSQISIMKSSPNMADLYVFLSLRLHGIPKMVIEVCGFCHEPFEIV